ncbi:MAG: zonular occludens toxin domain-containing protein [Thermoplasmata archaeon]
MKGFYVATGRQGSGKTVYMVKHLIDNMGDRPIFSNITLKGIPFTRITFNKPDKEDDVLDILEVLTKDPNYFNNSIMLLDEIHIYFDSLDFMKENSRKLHAFFSQLRKRDILLFATTQYILNLDVRIRRQALYVFDMTQHKQDIFEVNMNVIDGYYTEFVRRELYNLSGYFKYYDTNEIVT